MNEIKVSVPREVALEQQRLPLFRLNRRFIICCALCAATLRLALAEIPPTQRREVRATTPPPPVTLAESTSPTDIPRESALSESAAWQIIESQRKKDTGDRWEQFEAEFGIDGKRRTGVLGSVQSAKYALDEMTFTVDDFTRNVSDSLKLEYDHGGLHRAATLDDNARPTSAGPWSEIPRGVRFGPELSLEGGQPYVGLVVVVRFGD